MKSLFTNCTRSQRTYALFLCTCVLLINGCVKDDETNPKNFSLTAIHPTSGIIGSKITITGQGFSENISDNIVKFNDISVPVSKSNDTVLETTIPDTLALGDYSVSIEQAGLQSAKKLNFRVFGWKKIATAPFKRSSAFSFIIDNTLYVGGGVDLTSVNSPTYDDFWSYNFVSNKWTRLANYPGGKVGGAVSFVVNRKGYVGVGHESQKMRTNEFWEYNPINNQWVRIADFPGLGRTEAVSFSLNNKGYVGNGNADGVNYLNDFYAYDPSLNQWIAIAKFSGEAIYGQRSFVLGNKAYLVGGVIGTDKRVSQCWEYDSNQDAWQRKADFPGKARLEGVGFSINNKGYFGMGSIQNNEPGTDMWEYDPQQDSWNQSQVFAGTPRFAGIYGSLESFGVFGLGDEVYTEFYDIWLFLPEGANLN